MKQALKRIIKLESQLKSLKQIAIDTKSHDELPYALLDVRVIEQSIENLKAKNFLKSTESDWLEIIRRSL